MEKIRQDTLMPLVDAAQQAQTFEDYYQIEQKVFAVLKTPLQNIVQKSPGYWKLSPYAKSLRLQELYLIALEAWREWAAPVHIDLAQPLVNTVVCFLNKKTPDLFDRTRKTCRKKAMRLFIPPCGCALSKLPANVLHKIIRHSHLQPFWKKILLSFQKSNAAGFDPGKSSFLYWIQRKFLWKLQDAYFEENFVVSCSVKTHIKCFRENNHNPLPAQNHDMGNTLTLRQENGQKGWIPFDPYDAREHTRLENQSALDWIMRSVKEKERKFLESFLAHHCSSKKHMSQKTNVSPSWITKQFKKIRKNIDPVFVQTECQTGQSLCMSLPIS